MFNAVVNKVTMGSEKEGTLVVKGHIKVLQVGKTQCTEDDLELLYDALRVNYTKAQIAKLAYAQALIPQKRNNVRTGESVDPKLLAAECMKLACKDPEKDQALRDAYNDQDAQEAILAPFKAEARSNLQGVTPTVDLTFGLGGTSAEDID